MTKDTISEIIKTFLDLNESIAKISELISNNEHQLGVLNALELKALQDLTVASGYIHDSAGKLWEVSRYHDQVRVEVIMTDFSYHQNYPVSEIGNIQASIADLTSALNRSRAGLSTARAALLRLQSNHTEIEYPRAETTGSRILLVKYQGFVYRLSLVRIGEGRFYAAEIRAETF